MARPKRVNLPGGIYYVVLRSSAATPLIASEEDRQLFEDLLRRSLQRSRAVLHAYCWLPDAAHFAVQVSDIPLSSFVQRVCAPYSLGLHKQGRRKGPVFHSPYRAELLSGDQYLLDLVHYIHLLPLKSGVVQDLVDYSWSSHGTYIGRSKPRFLSMDRVLALLSRRDDQPLSAYQTLLATPEHPRIVARLNAGTLSGPRVIGDERIVRLRIRASAPSQPATSLDEIVDAVAFRLHLPREQLYLPTRRRIATVARALVAAYAIHAGVATLTDMARHFRRGPSTIRVGIDRYQGRCANLFSHPLDALLKAHRLSERAHEQGTANPIEGGP
jgi:REP element-mobilizing transposase RayT